MWLHMLWNYEQFPKEPGAADSERHNELANVIKTALELFIPTLKGPPWNVQCAMFVEKG